MGYETHEPASLTHPMLDLLMGFELHDFMEENVPPPEEAFPDGLPDDATSIDQRDSSKLPNGWEYERTLPPSLPGIESGKLEAGVACSPKNPDEWSKVIITRGNHEAQWERYNGELQAVRAMTRHVDDEWRRFQVR